MNHPAIRSPALHPIESITNADFQFDTRQAMAYTQLKTGFEHMNANIRNSALALIALASLAIYILACTSFSPDDKKILYPSTEPDSGAVALAIYDRETGRSQVFFTPMIAQQTTTNDSDAVMFRAQWMPDGRRVLVAWACDSDAGKGLNFALLPYGTPGATKLFHVPALDEPVFNLLYPPCLAGERVFFMADDGIVGRLDLITGVVAAHEFAKSNDLSLYPDPSGKTVFYFERRDQAHIFGRLNPENFAQTPLVTFTNEAADGGFFAYDPAGKRLAIVEGRDGDRQVIVLDETKQVFSRPLPEGSDEVNFGNAVFIPGIPAILATFQRKLSNPPGAAYGIMEIPLSKEPLRERVLVPKSSSTDKEMAFYFQVSVSHDGKIAAVASTYVAVSHEASGAEDCALFLVDLASRERRVSKVPIPLPLAGRNQPAK